jgi:hypothetical protein
MSMKLEDLLNLIAQAADRAELLGLSERYHEARQARETNETARMPTADARQRELLEQVMQRIHWHFRAIRHPIPTPEEVDEMIRDYFK